MFPAIYGVALQGQGEGTKLGAPGLVMAILGGALLPLTGTVQARAASGTFTSAPGGQPTPLTAGATQCMQ